MKSQLALLLIIFLGLFFVGCAQVEENLYLEPEAEEYTASSQTSEEFTGQVVEENLSINDTISFPAESLADDSLPFSGESLNGTVVANLSLLIDGQIVEVSEEDLEKTLEQYNFTLPPGFGELDVVYVPPSEPEVELDLGEARYSIIPGLENEVSYRDNPPQRLIPLTSETILEEEREFIISHYVDFYGRGGVGFENDRDVTLHNIYVQYLEVDLWSELLIEAESRFVALS